MAGRHPFDVLVSMFDKTDDMVSGESYVDPRTDSTFDLIAMVVTNSLHGPATSYAGATGYVYRIDEDMSPESLKSHYSHGRQKIARVALLNQKDFSFLCKRPLTYDETLDDMGLISLMLGFSYGPKHNNITVGKIVDVTFFGGAGSAVSSQGIGRPGVPNGTISKIWDYEPILFPPIKKTTPHKDKFKRHQSLKDITLEESARDNEYVGRPLYETELTLSDYRIYEWTWPVDSSIRVNNTRGFGKEYQYEGGKKTGKTAPHNGVDIGGRSNLNTPVFAVAAGVVTYMKSKPGKNPAGCHIEIYHGLTPDGRGIKSRSLHLNTAGPDNESINSPVKEGDVVAKGDVIGYLGTTGNSTGPHLHFEIWLTVFHAQLGRDSRVFKDSTRESINPLRLVMTERPPSDETQQGNPP